MTGERLKKGLCMKNHLMKKVAALLLSGIMTASMSMQALAFYNTPESIKGIHSSHVTMIQDMVELGCKQVIFQFNASFLKDENRMQSIDALVDAYNNADLTVTIGVMNDFQPNDELVPADFAVSNLYQFNTLTDGGKLRTEEVANALAHRYKDKISNWVIGNEINNQLQWNYLGVSDINEYARVYAEGFRIFYNAIKTANPDARVFIPFDYNWTCPEEICTMLREIF